MHLLFDQHKDDFQKNLTIYFNRLVLFQILRNNDVNNHWKASWFKKAQDTWQVCTYFCMPLLQFTSFSSSVDVKDKPTQEY